MNAPTPAHLRANAKGLVIVDLFCGGGGVSYAIQQALGSDVTVAVNHDPAAIAMHAANHPDTIHYQEDVFKVQPWRAVSGRRVDLLWASPDCKHFSRARGGKPVDKGIRSLADVVIDWARSPSAPRVICVENVPEFQTWGPLDEQGKRIKARQGEHFFEWVRSLRMCGYRVEWDVLVCADYGDPTSRRRLFVVARCDGQPIVWPAKTHGPGAALPWRTAAECIDWSIPCPSIFTRKRPLAEATQRRVAAGIRKYVLGAAKPFIVTNTSGNPARGVDRPLKTTTSAGNHLLVAPSLIQTGYGERKGQAPRTLDLQQPLGTVVAAGQKHALVSAFLAKHYGGPNGKQTPGASMQQPVPTITSSAQMGPVAVHLTKFYGTSKAGTDIALPMPTVTSGGGRRGGHAGLVAAFLVKYFKQGGQWSGLDQPMHTVTAKHRMGLVTVDLDGEPHVLTDIGLRMLQPRELARAHSFPDSYILTGTKSQQVARIGRSVPAQVVESVVRAQFGRASQWMAA